MRALGFYVGVTHAQYMARRFNELGIPAAFVVGQTSSEDRDGGAAETEGEGDPRPFAVDIFNESMEVPQIAERPSMLSPDLPSLWSFELIER